MTQVATKASDSILARLQETLEAGGNLYEAAHQMASELPSPERNALWSQKGGEMLYAWTIKILSIKRRRASGLPLGYREDKEDYAQDRIDEVLSQWVGLLDGDVPHLVQIGAAGKGDTGCRGVAANYQRLERSEAREASRWLQLDDALDDGQLVRDMERNLFTQIWWAP